MKAKIAAFNNGNLVLNKGQQDGVRMNERFGLVAYQDISDPDTGEALAQLRQVKAEFRVKELLSRVAIAWCLTMNRPSLSVGDELESLD